jgi:arginyl-tRNA synthetase
MSKRTGNVVYIDDLIEEVGNDAARFFFLMYSPDTHMNFDLGLAKQKSDENPVYYVQYAHARMCSIVREVEQVGVPKLTSITVEHVAEKALLKQLSAFPELLQAIGQTYEVHYLTTYAIDLARAFHHFYAHCRVIDNGTVNASRYALLLAARIVLKKTLGLIGVSAPEKM